MKPYKVYPNLSQNQKKSLLKLFTEEGSILGSDIDKDGKYFIIVDMDSSPYLKMIKEGRGLQ